MLQAALRDGTADRRCVFEVFARRLPEGRRYGVVAGTGRLLDAIPHFRYGDEQLARLRDTGVLDTATCDWLANYRFVGDIDGYAEGEVFFPGSPVLTVEGTFAEAVLLETLALSHPQPRQRRRLRGRPDGVRRRRPAVHRDGFPAHPRGGRRRGGARGLPGRLRDHSQPGCRHALRRAHRRHRGALLDPAAREGGRRVPRPGRRARGRHHPAGRHLRHRRRASGRRSRSPGPTSGRSASTPATSRCSPTRPAPSSTSSAPPGTRIVLSGDLDEYALAALATAPVDAYGVGTSVVTGSGAPTAGFVYKLVEVDGRAGGQALRGQGLPTAAARPRSAGTAPPAPRRRRSCTRRARPAHRDGRPRPAGARSSGTASRSTYPPSTSPART